MSFDSATVIHCAQGQELIRKVNTFTQAQTSVYIVHGVHKKYIAKTLHFII